MMKSLKIKLVMTISLLIVVLFTLSTYLLINEKSKELTQDIFTNARSFAELTSLNVVSDYTLYLTQNSFVNFNRNIKDTFAKFQDLSGIQIVSYGGDILYDSKTESEKQYSGPVRKVQNSVLLEQLKSKNPSVYTLDSGRVVYLKKDDNGVMRYTNLNEKTIAPIAPDEKIAYLVQPADNEHYVVYALSYVNLQDRITQSAMRSVLLAIFSVAIAVLLAYVYASNITKPLKELTLGAGVIAKGDFKHRVEIKTDDEIETLANAFNSMAKELEISTKALVYKERVAKELELAAKIQKELLPKIIPQVGGMDIAAGLLPAEEIGGDCYDFIKTDPSNMLMYLGDVTGHGVPSGIVVSIANALIYNFAGQANIKDILISVNKILKDKTTSNMFMTLVMIHWNAMENKLKYVSAGHEQMLLYHAADKKVTMLPSGGLALGMFPNIANTLRENDVPMEKDDVLVAYSDGIPECWKNEKEMYGMGRLKRAVNEYSDLPTAFSIRNALLADVKEYAAGYKQMDDITIMVLKKK